MLHALVKTAGRFWNDLNRAWSWNEMPAVCRSSPHPVANGYHCLQRVLLTDEVARNLFHEYAAHREGSRGHEETGWLLLGHREAEEAIVLATLPAGAQCSAGVAHVQFNTSAQALASRILRQNDRRLTLLGLVHTHPGSLRHPSDGDFAGDSQWVRQLRGEEGVFGIGTADGPPSDLLVYAQQPKPHVQCLGELRLSWYALRKGDCRYRSLSHGMTLGQDLGRPLRPVWPAIESHADRLDRLVRQQAGVTFQVVSSEGKPALAVNLPLAEPESFLRVFVTENEVRYYLMRSGDLLEADPREALVDRGVYLLLAELAAQS
jgi:proteasome lid subunit RPN8/RPN11